MFYGFACNNKPFYLKNIICYWSKFCKKKLFLTLKVSKMNLLKLMCVSQSDKLICIQFTFSIMKFHYYLFLASQTTFQIIFSSFQYIPLTLGMSFLAYYSLIFSFMINISLKIKILCSIIKGFAQYFHNRPHVCHIKETNLLISL